MTNRWFPQQQFNGTAKCAEWYVLLLWFAG